MKACPCLAAVVVIGVATTAWAVPTPLLHYTFDNDYAADPTGKTAVNSGSLGAAGNVALAKGTSNENFVAWDLHSANGAGMNGGRALDQTGLTLAGLPVEEGTIATSNRTAGDLNELDELVSFTVTAWVKGPMANTAWLVDSNGRVDGWSVAGQMRVEGFARGGNSSTFTDWTFVVARYRYIAADDQTRFQTFKGDATTAATQTFLASFTGDHDGNKQITGDTALGIAVGGRVNNFLPNDTFFGLIDDLRVFASKTDLSGYLSDEDIELVRLDGIPEPGSLTLLGLGAAVGLCRRVRRRDQVRRS